jgi:hypothetical protein
MADPFWLIAGADMGEEEQRAAMLLAMGAAVLQQQQMILAALALGEGDESRPAWRRR